MIVDNVPNHLVVGARQGFLNAIRTAPPMPYRRVAEIIPVTTASGKLTDLGSTPHPVKSTGQNVNQDMIERSLDWTPIDWEITVNISHNAIQDDQSGTLLSKVKSAGANFPAHINQYVFAALNAGEGTTYGACYDGLSFFNDAHVDKGAKYSTTQDNKLANALSLDNFTTTMAAAEVFKNDMGKNTGFRYNLLVVPPALRYLAAQITQNSEAYDTASREMNPFAGALDFIVTPEYDATAWTLHATAEGAKSIGVIMREEPHLLHAWFDPNQKEGGLYYFKFFARYNVVYLDWRTAIMGNT